MRESKPGPDEQTRSSCCGCLPLPKTLRIGQTACRLHPPDPSFVRTRSNRLSSNRQATRYVWYRSEPLHSCDFVQLAAQARMRSKKMAVKWFWSKYTNCIPLQCFTGKKSGASGIARYCHRRGGKTVFWRMGNSIDVKIGGGPSSENLSMVEQAPATRPLFLLAHVVLDRQSGKLDEFGSGHFRLGLKRKINFARLICRLRPSRGRRHSTQAG